MAEHKRQQAELKMRNRKVYEDGGFVFAREHADLTTPRARLGQPMPSLDSRAFRQLTKAAGVKPIKFHGLRHTAATLQLLGGEAVHVVAKRLGHANATMTLAVYARCIPDDHAAVAARLAATAPRSSSELVASRYLISRTVRDEVRGQRLAKFLTKLPDTIPTATARTSQT